MRQQLLKFTMSVYNYFIQSLFTGYYNFEYKMGKIKENIYSKMGKICK